MAIISGKTLGWMCSGSQLRDRSESYIPYMSAFLKLYISHIMTPSLIGSVSVTDLELIAYGMTLEQLDC